MRKKIESAVQALSQSDDKSLYAKLGAYAIVGSQDPGQLVDAGAAVQIDAQTAGPLSDSIELGKRILRSWNKALYELICADADPQAKKTIANALSLKSPDAIAAAITGVLISTFSVLPAVATVVGVLLARVLLPATAETVCDFWKEKLPRS